MISKDAQAAAILFQDHFEAQPDAIWFAPGRINLIGEHVDYSGGFVMPAAIALGVYVALRARNDQQSRVVTSLGDRKAEFSAPITGRGEGPLVWSDYVRAALWAAGAPGGRGWDIALHSTLPVGAGLSASAALSVGLVSASLDLIGQRLSPLQVAQRAQAAENQFIGAKCGLMDQFASACGQADHALLLDCASLDHHPIAMPSGYSWLVVDSGVRHSVAEGDYGSRSDQSAAVVAAARALFPSVAVRALSDEQEAQLSARLDPLLARRLKHMVSENRRVLAMEQALTAGDMAKVGKILNASHVSMRDDYEISCAEVDQLSEIAWETPGVLGARMTGGGFGGCVLTLTPTAQAQAVRDAIAARYRTPQGAAPVSWICQVGDGARRLAP